MQSKSDFPERRQFERINTAMSVQYRGIRQANGSVISAISRDISTGGVRMLVNEFISVFTRLVLDIAVPSTTKPVRVVSKVAWVRKRPYGEQYEVGVEFVDMPDEDRRSIFDFVERSVLRQ
ncbi:MAG TPA: PilZ domain-containing protein [Candidatus Omnitrophota bacterium]|nr:PilZ domain-containing protein [Candidatus Omnitrophota bacterium]MDD5270342.1 PilZ domain-containing protein [Candidatus Omnitrophota bacterium]MDD5737291.1 PilZ domain-containing protein [Candidatus Omnitrophota bacterium]HOX09847.1 PilZ domain-containing protein [Candidatus Omnitrophota bacterium]HPN65905.1 PilZ domain-containing protein [Candidatus Omnitrophota bacterium]